jgi:hypothetical protein
MIEKFLKKVKLTGRIKDSNECNSVTGINKELDFLLKRHGGAIFENGLYRLHTFESCLRWSSIIPEYFEAYQNNMLPFGFDWMGRQFCMSTADSGSIYLFDPATEEVLDIDQSLHSLHNVLFTNDAADVLDAELFGRLRAFYSLQEISFDQCLGFRIPLFLGGVDALENYEICNMEVYWEITKQLKRQVDNLPDGTVINRINIL